MRRLGTGLFAAVFLCACAHEQASTPGAERAPDAASGGVGADGAAEDATGAVDDPAVDERSVGDPPGEGEDKPPKGPPAKAPDEEPANPVPVQGERELLALAALPKAPAPVSLGAFDVACLRAPEALASPEEAARALESAAKAQGVRLGHLLLVRIERDPARRAKEPHARVCRPVASDAELYAPLFREKERARRWAVAPAGGDLKEDLRRLLDSARAARGAPADRPYALVVGAKVVLLALPLSGRD